MEPNSKQESANLISLLLKFGFSIVVGILGKISYDVSSGRKMSIWAWFAITIMSCFVGYISGMICDYYSLSNSAIRIIIPLSTLFGESIITICFKNFGKIFTNWLIQNMSYFTNALKGKKDD